MYIYIYIYIYVYIYILCERYERTNCRKSNIVIFLQNRKILNAASLIFKPFESLKEYHTTF